MDAKLFFTILELYVALKATRQIEIQTGNATDGTQDLLDAAEKNLQTALDSVVFNPK